MYNNEWGKNDRLVFTNWKSRKGHSHYEQGIEESGWGRVVVARRGEGLEIKGWCLTMRLFFQEETQFTCVHTLECNILAVSSSRGSSVCHWEPSKLKPSARTIMFQVQWQRSELKPLKMADSETQPIISRAVGDEILNAWIKLVHVVCVSLCYPNWSSLFRNKQFFISQHILLGLINKSNRDIHISQCQFFHSSLLLAGGHDYAGSRNNWREAIC